MDKTVFKKYTLLTKISAEPGTASEPLIEGCV